jgi:Uma2 family endonuclease
LPSLSRRDDTLHLVIEALSPSTARADRFTKRRLFQEQRIPEYWIIDIEQQQVEIWTPDAMLPTVERERLAWQHPELDATCVIELEKIFGK